MKYYNAKKPHTFIKDPIEFFIKDARNILAHFAQTFNISIMGQSQNDKNIQESFWTTLEGSSGLSKKLVFLVKPFLPANNEKMKKVYYQNRLF